MKLLHTQVPEDSNCNIGFRGPNCGSAVVSSSSGPYLPSSSRQQPTSCGSSPHMNLNEFTSCCDKRESSQTHSSGTILSSIKQNDLMSLASSPHTASTSAETTKSYSGRSYNRPLVGRYLVSFFLPLFIFTISLVSLPQISALSSVLTLQHSQYLDTHHSQILQIQDIIQGLRNGSVQVRDALYQLEYLSERGAGSVGSTSAAADLRSDTEDEKQSTTTTDSSPQQVTDPLGIASYNLAIIHKTSKFQQMDWIRYRDYIIKATMRGSFYASVELAFMLENGWIQDMNLLNEHMKQEKHLTLDNHESVCFHESADPNSVGMIYYTSAAMNGHTLAQMVLGYRYLYGINLKQRCSSAAQWYKKAAFTALDHLKNTHYLLSAYDEKMKISDEGAFQKRKQSEDIMNFFQYSAKKGVGNSQLIYALANMYGIRGIPQNAQKAKELFKQAVDSGEYSGYSSLGKMYAFGIGVEQNNETALEYYKQGTALGDPSSQNGLGVMYLKGLGVPTDVERAYYYFNESATHGIAEAQYNLGLLYLSGNGAVQSYKRAYHYITLAAQQALPLAQYYLGVMHLNGWGTPKSCDTAVKFFRHVAEKGNNMKYHDEAFEKYYHKNYAEALLYYHQLAATGDEVAQENAAYLYDKLIGTDYLFKHVITSTDTPEYYAKSRALSLYREAAAQGIVEAHVRVGDYYYYGKGTDRDYTQSVHHYRKAYQKNNARATFNLGYMHENGLGLSQDYFLAKRYYDMAMTFDDKAKLPCMLALGKLYVRWGYKLLSQRISGGVLFNQFSQSGQENDDGRTDHSSQTEEPPSSQKEEDGHSTGLSDNLISLLFSLSDPTKLLQVVRENENVYLGMLVAIFILLQVLRQALEARQQRRRQEEQENANAAAAVDG